MPVELESVAPITHKPFSPCNGYACVLISFSELRLLKESWGQRKCEIASIILIYDIVVYLPWWSLV